MAAKTSQDYFWALTVAGLAYLGLMLVGLGGFIGLMVAGSVFSWVLKGDSDKKEEEVESLIRPPREWRDVSKPPASSHSGDET